MHRQSLAFYSQRFPMTRITHLGAFSSWFASILAVGGLGAQDLKRVPLPVSGKSTLVTQNTQAKTAVPQKAEMRIDEKFVTNATRVNPTDDEPNFAPMVSEPAEDDLDRKMDRKMRIDGNPYRLSFTNGDYAPKRGVDPDLVRDLTAVPNGKVFGFIMIRGRITPAKVKALTDLGVELLGPHTWQSIKAEIPVGSLNTLAGTPFVHWVGYARPAQKLDKVLAEALKTVPAKRKLKIWVNFFKSDMSAGAEKIVVGENRTLSPRHDEGSVTHTVPNGRFQKALEELGFEFSFYSDSTFAMQGWATKAQILQIRDLNFVVSVEMEHGEGTVDHDQSLAMVSVDRVRGAFPGVGVAMGWIDTGIDSSPWHQDFSSKNFRAWRTTTQSAYQDGHGHGTHVAGTIFGRGLADRRYTGVAPSIGLGASNDRIYVGRFLNNSGSAVGNPKSLWDVFKVSTTINGITTPKRMIVSNSWSFKSSSGYNGTEQRSRDLDNVIHTYQQTYVHSSGNTGGTPGSWCGSPSVAKNVLTVGSVRDWFSSTVKPGNVVTNVRYRTTDGRRKPEITAPGETLTSTRYNTSTSYSNKSGTSMSTPTVAGVLASVVDRNTPFYDYNPSALRALAVASAKFGTGVGFDGTYKQGFGMINAYKMNYGGSRSTFYVRSGSLTWPSNLATFDRAISSSCTQLKVVLSWTERAASASASKARVNALRLYFDTPPYTSGATGNYSMSNSKDTVIYAISLTNALKGKTVRFKVHAYSLALFQKVNWSVAIFQYFKPLTSSPNLNQTVNKTLIKPSQSVVLTSTLTAKSTQDEFNNAQIYFSSPTTWTNTRIDRTTADNKLQTYTGSTHASYPYPRLGAGTSRGMTVGQGSSRRIKFTMRAPATSGLYNLYTRARHHGSSFTKLSNASTVCVDGLRPNTATGLSSTTHTPGAWSNKTAFTAVWGTGTDVGCAGIKGYAWRLSSGAPSSPTFYNTTLKTRSLTLTHNTSGYYFNLKNVDKVNNFSLSTRWIGPFRIDLIKPVVSSVSVNNGAAYTSSSTVSVRVTATDSGSGVNSMRFSGNGSSWTPWRTYSTLPQTIAMGSYGWTTEGTRFAYVQVRDRAGNISTTKTDSIIWLRAPKITGATVSSLPNVTRSRYRLVGTDFLGVNRGEFSGSVITTPWTSANDDWWNKGAFRILSDTVMDVYPPQCKPAGTHAVRCRNAVYYSNTFNVTVTYQAGRILYTNSNSTAGKPFTIVMARSGFEPATTQGLIVLSPFNSPSVAPGIVTLEIGLNFTAYAEVIQTSFNSARCIHLTVPTLASYSGLTAWFEGVYMRSPLPLPTTNAWKVTFN